MAVRTLDPLVGDTERGGLQLADVGVLPGDRHVHDLAIEPLDLVSVETELGRQVAHALEHLFFALRIAERRSGIEFGVSDLLDQRHPLFESREDPTVDRFDGLADGLEIGGLAHAGDYSVGVSEAPSAFTSITARLPCAG